jgi:hypothetical protein
VAVALVARLKQRVHAGSQGLETYVCHQCMLVLRYQCAKKCFKSVGCLLLQKGGQMLPGKKGVMLTVEQWQTLLGSLGSIQTALDAKDTACVVELGSK